jgi:hypothetical protein
MNKRIEALEKQATTVVEGWSDENGTTRYYEFNREKFAELIVKECAEIIKDSPWKLGHGCTPSEQAALIKEHFGVERCGTMMLT